AVGKNGDAECSTAISEIEPLVRRHFKLPLVVVAALNRADVPVVSRVWIRSRERESRFQIRTACVPVNDAAELYSISSIACGQTHCLLKLRTLCFAHDLNGHADRSILNHTHLRLTTNI